MDRASGLGRVDPRHIDEAKQALRASGRAPLSVSGQGGQQSQRATHGRKDLAAPADPAAGALMAALAEAEATSSKARSRPRRPERVEVVTRSIDEGLDPGAFDSMGLGIGGDEPPGKPATGESASNLGTVAQGGSMGVIYEAETDSEFDEEDWGPAMEAEERSAFAEAEAVDAEARLRDISNVRRTLAHRRMALEGRALQVGADPKAARALVRAGEDGAVTAPTSGRRRSTEASAQARAVNPRSPVEAPLPGTFGNRRISLEVKVPRLRSRPPTDPAVLPVTLPDAPAGTSWHWVPEMHTALPRPDGWNVAQGWGGFMGMRLLSAAVTPEDPLVLNEDDPVVRDEAHLAVHRRKEALRRAELGEDVDEDSLLLAGAADGDAGDALPDAVIRRDVDGNEVTLVSGEAMNEQEARRGGIGRMQTSNDVDDPAATVTASDPSKHFLRLGLTYKAYVGAFTCEALNTKDPKELSKFFLTLALKRFLPPVETAADAMGAASAGDTYEMITGKAAPEGHTPWTQEQVSAAMEASSRGEDPVAAAEAAGQEAASLGAGTAPAIGFRYSAFPHLDKPDGTIEPVVHDQWGYELVPGRVYGYGALASVKWSPMGPDDPSHRVNGGMRLAVSFTMDVNDNVLHEVIFRAPACMWDDAWAAHGQQVMDDVCINWRDDSTQKFA
ncbi:hypothetical protein FNF31_07279 [Cafeteria roenbergensis]|uniref:Uncharacterized protein n=1 Tax=Cafeteria roenbergensis TaxID=33653 RepID=A0A5A8C7Z2_CAFRO|nr:hypothetical protein FNF31_07279 [Cafeteria roenbergensis]KAA0158843.1 hypothetical protein FNF28_06088 [Cafeteria roenbergensis]